MLSRLTSLLIVLTLLVGILWYLQSAPEQSTSEVSQATADWQTYTDETFGYSISYPPTAEIRQFDTVNPIVGIHLPELNNSIIITATSSASVTQKAAEVAYLDWLFAEFRAHDYPFTIDDIRLSYLSTEDTQIPFIFVETPVSVEHVFTNTEFIVRAVYIPERSNSQDPATLETVADVVQTFIFTDQS